MENDVGGGIGAEEYLLQFNNYANFLTSGVEACRNQENFVDVSLVADSGAKAVHKAHRVILSACSPYFEEVLSCPELPRWQHPVLLLRDIPEEDLKDILTFVYVGKVSVPQQRFQSFLTSAQSLKIRGLADAGAAATTTDDAGENGKLPAKGQPSPEPCKENAKQSLKRSKQPSPLLSQTSDSGHKRLRRSSVVTATITPASAPPCPIPNKKTGNALETLIVIKNEPLDESEEGPKRNTNEGSGKSSTSPNGSASEHLVITADPTLMEGLDSDIVEGDSGGTKSGPSNAPPLLDGTQDQSLDKNVAEAGRPTPGKSNDTSSANNLVVLFSEKGRCHFCRLLCPDVTSLRVHLETVHQPPRHALCENCENFFHICAIQRHRQKCTETYQSEKK